MIQRSDETPSAVLCKMFPASFALKSSQRTIVEYGARQAADERRLARVDVACRAEVFVSESRFLFEWVRDICDSALFSHR